MDQLLLGAVVVVLVTLPSVCHLYIRHSLPIAQNTNTISDGIVTKHWIFPYKFERMPMLSKRKLKVDMNELCSVEVKKVQCRCDPCENALTPVSRLPSRQRCVVGRVLSHNIITFQYSASK